MLDRVLAMVKSAVTRGKVVTTAVGARTFLQISGMDGVLQQTVEMLLPHGFSARPLPQSDVLLLQVLGSGDHVVALGGDMAGNAIADLAPGEFGLSDGTQMIVFRIGNMIQMISPTKVRIESPRLECTGAIVENCDAAGASVGLGTHTHPTPDGTSSPPTPGT